MDRAETVQHFIDAINAGTFITPKHDLNEAHMPIDDFRSIPIQNPTEIKTFLESGQYDLTKFQNPKFPKSPDTWLIKPYDSTMVAGSGIMPMATTFSVGYDSFIVASGTKIGLHIYADNAATIEKRIADGKYFDVEYM